MDWFRLYHRMLWDSKVRILTDAEFRLWVGLLCLASQNKRRGIVERDTGAPMSPLEIQQLVGVEAFKRADLFDPSERVAQALHRLASLKLISLRHVRDSLDPIIKITNFARLQYDYPSQRPEATRERKRKQRAGSSRFMSRAESRVGHELSRRDTDTDTETETETDKRKLPPLPPLAVLWNQTVKTPSVLRVSGQRLIHLKARMQTYPDLAWWQQVLDRIVATPFLRGKNNRGWAADFDWLIRNDENAARVLEGKYDARREDPKPRAAIQDLPSLPPEEAAANLRRLGEIASTIAARRAIS